MAIELDHVFICTRHNATVEAGRLTAFGLTEGAANSHPGQGTACRRFFFHNAYLELLWVSDSIEARSETVRPTRLCERWTRRGHHACPFGLGFRSQANQAGKPPFAVWEYRPPYLPESWTIQVARNSDALSEPMLFHLPFARRSDARSNASPQPLEHCAGLREISHVELVTPHARSISPELQALINAGLLRVREGAKYLIELGFDGQTQGKRADFQPVLPLEFRW